MPPKIYLFVGTYTQPIIFGTGQTLEGKGKGIYRLELDAHTGALVEDGPVTEAPNPSYLTLDPSRNFLYTVNELKEYQSSSGGSVSAYRLNPIDNELTYLNTKPTGGCDPCHIAINAENTHVFVCNFMSGSIAILPIAKDGSLEDASKLICHSGSSVDKIRQTSPHTHSLVFDLDNRFAFVPDLGIDKVMIYKTDFTNGGLIPNAVPDFSVKPGAGPRHCVFHSSYKYCYLINELNSTILVLSYDVERGIFEEIQEVSSIIEPFEGDNICADVHITPDDKFLYGSNRGHDSIVIYAIDQETGRLGYVDTVSCGGRTPRNFAIDPTGKFVLVANQDTDNITVFKIDQNTGKLSKVFEYFLPTPVCIKAYLL